MSDSPKSEQQAPEPILVTGVFGEERIWSGPTPGIEVMWTRRRVDARLAYNQALAEAAQATMKEIAKQQAELLEEQSRRTGIIYDGTNSVDVAAFASRFGWRRLPGYGSLIIEKRYPESNHPTQHRLLSGDRLSVSNGDVRFHRETTEGRP